MAADAALEVGAAEVLHDDEVGVAVLAPVVDADDIRALQTGGRLRLLLEARGERGIARILRQHDLDGHGAVEHLVLSAVHGGHASVADLVLQKVASSQNPLFFHFLYSSFLMGACDFDPAMVALRSKRVL